MSVTEMLTQSNNNDEDKLENNKYHEKLIIKEITPVASMNATVIQLEEEEEEEQEIYLYKELELPVLSTKGNSYSNENDINSINTVFDATSQNKYDNMNGNGKISTEAAKNDRHLSGISTKDDVSRYDLSSRDCDHTEQKEEHQYQEEHFIEKEGNCEKWKQTNKSYAKTIQGERMLQEEQYEELLEENDALVTEKEKINLRTCTSPINLFHKESNQLAQPEPSYVFERNSHNTNLFIRNLAPEVDQHELNVFFEPFGNIVSSAIMRNIHTGVSLGTAFVRFETHEQAEHAMQMLNNKIIAGRPFCIQWANKHEGAPVGEARKKIHKLFVRNIPLDLSVDALTTYFSQFGPVCSVSLHKDTAPVVNKYLERRISFVTFEADGVADRTAKCIHNTQPFASCNGIPLMVKLAEDIYNKAEHRRRHHSVCNLQNFHHGHFQPQQEKQQVEFPLFTPEMEVSQASCSMTSNSFQSHSMCYSQDCNPNINYNSTFMSGLFYNDIPMNSIYNNNSYSNSNSKYCNTYEWQTDLISKEHPISFCTKSHNNSCSSTQTVTANTYSSFTQDDTEVNYYPNKQNLLVDNGIDVFNGVDTKMSLKENSVLHMSNNYSYQGANFNVHHKECYIVPGRNNNYNQNNSNVTHTHVSYQPFEPSSSPFTCLQEASHSFYQPSTSSFCVNEAYKINEEPCGEYMMDYSVNHANVNCIAVPALSNYSYLYNTAANLHANGNIDQQQQQQQQEYSEESCYCSSGNFAPENRNVMYMNAINAEMMKTINTENNYSESITKLLENTKDLFHKTYNDMPLLSSHCKNVELDAEQKDSHIACTTSNYRIDRQRLDIKQYSTPHVKATRCLPFSREASNFNVELSQEIYSCNNNNNNNIINWLQPVSENVQPWEQHSCQRQRKVLHLNDHTDENEKADSKNFFTVNNSDNYLSNESYIKGKVIYNQFNKVNELQLSEKDTEKDHDNIQANFSLYNAAAIGNCVTGMNDSNATCIYCSKNKTLHEPQVVMITANNANKSSGNSSINSSNNVRLQTNFEPNIIKHTPLQHSASSASSSESESIPLTMAFPIYTQCKNSELKRFASSDYNDKEGKDVISCETSHLRLRESSIGSPNQSYRHNPYSLTFSIMLNDEKAKDVSRSPVKLFSPETRNNYLSNNYNSGNGSNHSKNMMQQQLLQNVQNILL